MDRKEEIIMATLKLASKFGLKSVSMSMIADEVGIKKPSLYNHFESKEQLVAEMYKFLRNKAKNKANIDFDVSKWSFSNAISVENVLKSMVYNYITIAIEDNMLMFYKLIYSERAFSENAKSIVCAETDKMINATCQIFQMMDDKKLLTFNDVYISAFSFAMTIHGLIDYLLDKGEDLKNNNSLDSVINKYIINFVKEHKVGENHEEKID